VPSTLGEDGDPLDVMVLMDAPAHVGCLIEIRILGVIEAEQIEDGRAERNDQVLGVAIHSYDHQDLDSIDDVSKTLLDHEAFFISYNKQRGKSSRSSALGGPKKALKLLKQGMSAFNDSGTRNSSKSKSSH
jgi:inorganic pyrophosphatase